MSEKNTNDVKLDVFQTGWKHFKDAETIIGKRKSKGQKPGLEIESVIDDFIDCLKIIENRSMNKLNEFIFENANQIEIEKLKKEDILVKAGVEFVIFVKSDDINFDVRKQTNRDELPIGVFFHSAFWLNQDQAKIVRLQLQSLPNSHIPVKKIDKNMIKVLAFDEVLSKTEKLTLKMSIDENSYTMMNKVKCLVVKNREIDIIEKDSFEGLEKLEELYMSNNMIKTLVPHQFKGLEILTTLDLTDSGIEFIDDDCFSHLKKLVHLQLTGNKIKCLTSKTFKGLDSLKVLFLDYCAIESFEDCFSHLNKLEKLELSGNQSFKSNQFKGLVSLKELYLHDCKIESFEDDFFTHLDMIEQVQLSANRLKCIKSNAFKGLENLKVLDLSNSQIESFDEDCFSHLNKLEKLLLDCNKIIRLKSNVFKGLVSLEKLSLMNCEIDTIEKDSFEGLKKLKELYLNNSSELEKLFPDIEKNKIKELNTNQFNGLDNLETLDLFNCKIACFGNHCFEKLKKLQKLRLTDNPIKIIKANFFNGLDSLEQLFLGFCRIESIEADSFSSLLKLNELFLLQNNISTLDANLFRDSRELYELYIGNYQVIKNGKSIRKDELKSLLDGLHNKNIKIK